MGYLLAYIVMVAPLLFILINNQTLSPKTISTLKTLSPTHLGIISLLLLNLAGLPPLGGFCLKVIRLTLIIPSYPLMALILISSSVATLGFYIHISLVAIITAFQTLTPLSPPRTSLTFPLALGTTAAAILPAIPLLLL